MTYSIKENHGEEIKKIWEQIAEVPHLRKYYERGFCLPEFIDANVPVILGINPSFSKNSSKNENLENYYGNNHHSSQEKTIPFFESMRKLMGKKHWCHLDLLFHRETNQNEIHEILKTKEGVDFIYNQLMISKKIIEAINPIILIVANSLARGFLGFSKTENNNIWMDFSFKFHENIGTQTITEPEDLKNIPVFFTSMLSGQRALDIGSFQRLQWHINKILN